MAGTIKGVGGNDPALIWAAPAYGGLPRQFLLVNLDLATTIFYNDNPGISTQSPQIPPLGHASFDGTADVYASTLNPALTVLVQVMPGVGSWSPGVTAGTAPFVLGLKTASLVNQTASTFNFFVFPQAGRIWDCNLAFAASSNASYAGGLQSAYCQAGVFGGGGPNLAFTPCQLSLSAPSQSVAATASAQVPGFAAAKGQQLYLDLNAGVAITNALLSASVTVLYSIP